MLPAARSAAVAAAAAVGLVIFVPGHWRAGLRAEDGAVKIPFRHSAGFEESSGADEIGLVAAVASGQVVVVQFEGDGIAKLTGRLKNSGPRKMLVRVAAGTLLESGANQVMLVRDQVILLPAGRTVDREFPCVATRVTNTPGTHAFRLVDGRISDLASLVLYLAKHPELPLPAMQTAVLAVTDNPPLSTFAKFKLVAGESASSPHNPVFKVDVRYILQALNVLKKIGYPLDRVALTVDPQLEIEAMIDPMTHAEALSYYGILPSKEWAFWKNWLQKGDPRLRHYALYGIARYFPDTALQMLPLWVRDTRLGSAYRASAAKSLAETGRYEALSVLTQLQQEFRSDVGLDVALYNSSQLLTQSIYNPNRFHFPVEFRLTEPTLSESPGI